MSKALFLDELLEEPNISENYGLKTSGLVKLKHSLLENGLEKIVTIPNFFAIPVNFDLCDSSLKELYMKLTKGFDKPTIILSRSSDPNEKPGIFETHSILYDPSNTEQSFKDWLESAIKVKQSGARSLIVQNLAADLGEASFFPSNKNIECFGYNTKGFVGKSSNIFGNYASLALVWGLPSKIVNGDKNIMVFAEKYHDEFSIINMDQSYRSRWCYTNFEQEMIDIIKLSNPKNIETSKLWTYQKERKKQCLYEFDNNGGLTFQIEENNPSYLLKIINKIKKSFDTEIEIEGTIVDNQIHMFQLREYKELKRNFTKLTSVSDERLIITRPSIGSNKFSGDLYISQEIRDVPSDSIFYYDNDSGYHGEIPFDKLSNHKQLLINQHQFDRRGDSHFEHAYGLTLQNMVELQDRGVETIALGLGWGQLLLHLLIDYKDKIDELDEGFLRVKDVTVECNGLISQIYFNK